MSKKASLIYTIFGIAALIAIIAVFSLRIYFERNENSIKNSSSYKELQNIVASAYLAKGAFTHPFFSASMRNFIDKHPDFLSVVIYSSGGPHYIFSKDPTILTFPPGNNVLNWDGAPTFTIRPFFEKVRSSEISIPTRQGTYLSTVSVVLSQARLFLFIRDSIIAVASLLVVTIVFIALYPYFDNRKKAVAVSSTQPTNESIESPETIVEKTKVRDNEPSSGLFSPKTGLGWEQYLDSRLSFELRRAASYDQDLVLVLLRGAELEQNGDEYIRIAKYLLQHFLFQDMLFEYGKNGYAVILPNTDLDSAIKDVKTFRENVCSKKISGCIFSAGLSSRNGRLINGNRLIAEASMALSKAFNDPSNKIIAFRSDPQKYRQYIASKR